jgi:hypothetical protein
MRPSGAVMLLLLGRRKAKWSRCSPRISVSCHTSMLSRGSSSLGDQVLKRLQSPTPLWRPHLSIPIADILTIASCDGLVQQPNGIIMSEVKATHRLRRRSIVTSDDFIAIKTDVILVLVHRRFRFLPCRHHFSKSNNGTQAGPTPAMATVIRAVAAFSVRGTGSSWSPT